MSVHDFSNRANHLSATIDGRSIKISDGIGLLSQKLQNSLSVTILTGAGVSAASGVPIFRGPEGIWRKHRAEDLATSEAFIKNPKFVWQWYDWRRQLIARCHPNAAHNVLSLWSIRYSNFTLITQNVDGLHERAGTRNIVPFHGSIWEVSCWNKCRDSPISWIDKTTPLSEVPPSCPYCKGLVRPSVVWFGESISSEIISKCNYALKCDLFITIGTSAVVFPAAGLADEAKDQGAYTVEVNTEATPTSDQKDLVLTGPAEIILDQTEKCLAKYGDSERTGTPTTNQPQSIKG